MWRCEVAESCLIQPTYSTKRQGLLKQAALLFSVLMFAPPPQPQSSSMAETSKLYPDAGTFCRKINLHKHSRFFLTRPRGRAILISEN